MEIFKNLRVSSIPRKPQKIYHLFRWVFLDESLPSKTFDHLMMNAEMRFSDPPFYYQLQTLNLMGILQWNSTFPEKGELIPTYLDLVKGYPHIDFHFRWFNNSVQYPKLILSDAIGGRSDIDPFEENFLEKLRGGIRKVDQNSIQNFSHYTKIVESLPALLSKINREDIHGLSNAVTNLLTTLDYALER